MCKLIDFEKPQTWCAAQVNVTSFNNNIIFSFQNKQKENYHLKMCLQIQIISVIVIGYTLVTADAELITSFERTSIQTERKMNTCT